MSQSRMLAHNNNNNNVGSEQNSSGSDDDDSTPLSALTKGDLKVMMNRMLQSEITTMVRRAVHYSEPRRLQLQFQNKLSLPILTGRHIKGENCKSLNIALVDAFTGKVVKYGPEASARVEIVVRWVDPDSDEGHDWTPQEFNLKIAKESKEKKPLLTGNVFLNLKEGIGSADAIYFAHRSGWMKRCQFSLGARTVNNFDGTRVIEAKSEPFFLEDCRSKLYKKHHPPSMLDKVWRLEKISKNGAHHKRLSRENVHTVKDFLTAL